MKPFITSSDHLEFGVWPFGKVKALLQPQGMLSSPVNTCTMATMVTTATATKATATTATATATTATIAPVAATATDPHVFHNVHLAS